MYFILSLILIICMCILKLPNVITININNPFKNKLISKLEILYIPLENSNNPIIIELSGSLKWNIFEYSVVIILKNNIFENIIDNVNIVFFKEE